MSFVVSHDFIKLTTHIELKAYRDKVERDENNPRSYQASTDIEVESRQLSLDALNDMTEVARTLGDDKSTRALNAIFLARDGQFDTVIPNFNAFSSVLEAYLKDKLIDGWLYFKKQDDKLYPVLVTHITYKTGTEHISESILLHVCHVSPSPDRGYFGFQHDYVSFYPGDVVQKRIADALELKGVFKETPELKTEYELSYERYHQLIKDQFSEQFVAKGNIYKSKDDRVPNGAFIDVKVINDMSATDVNTHEQFRESCLIDGPDKLLALPEWPLVRVFNLNTHDYVWLHADYLTPYKYDKSLRDKLILPKSHRDLLDVLTTNVEAFSGDIIDGKTAGNVILCKGIPGVGKTLTAEVYSEIIERPLYLLHSGSLGTTAKEIEENLRVVFSRSERWGCVLLLDEADVFIVRRNDNIEQNAIVAEFLRTMEYFNGLLFMTTNRPNDIDEAIISRCAAIINYEAPTKGDASKIWQVIATQYSYTLSETLLSQLLDTFEGITPRDIKMLLRLALRVSAGKNAELDMDVFRQCAMFRAIRMVESEVLN
ncbi:ATP-binding protein [Pseudomonadota bacterium]|nr:ATP-binding protein [Pseudomonadota bacterium]